MKITKFINAVTDLLVALGRAYKWTDDHPELKTNAVSIVKAILRYYDKF